MNDIVERIDAATGRTYEARKQRSELLREAADELDYLYQLITAYCDVMDSKYSSETDYKTAIGYLRQAVGR